MLIWGGVKVDLGLPSGLLWAAGNLGAKKETDSGLFYAWGETTGYENGSGHVFDKANYTASAISADLTLIQDAANVRLGGNWRMPTKEDNLELCANCFAEWTSDYKGTGKAGVIYYSCTTNATGKSYYKGATRWNKLNGTSYSNASQPDGFVAYTLTTPHIFVPATGCFMNSASLSAFGDGILWSSSYGSVDDGFSLGFNNNDMAPQLCGDTRCWGLPIRAVFAE